MDEFRVRLVRGPWNRGKLVGQKTPLNSRRSGLRVRLQVFGRMRELALLHLAIDSKLRTACTPYEQKELAMDALQATITWAGLRHLGQPATRDLAAFRPAA
jgi:hypothetical protein